MFFGTTADVRSWRKAATRQSGEVSLTTKVHTGAVVNVGDESHDLLCLQMTTALEAVVNVRG